MGLMAEIVLGIYALTQLPPTPDVQMSPGMTLTIVGQVVILLTTLAGFAIQLYREHRNRKWDLEDRREAREQQRRETEMAAQKLAAKTEQTASKIIEKVQEGTEMSKKALAEANDVNKKIYNITRRFTESGATPGELDALAQIETTTKDIQEKVTDIQEAIVDDDRKKPT
jgi:seryl-tRNA synthetase